MDSAVPVDTLVDWKAVSLLHVIRCNRPPLSVASSPTVQRSDVLRCHRECDILGSRLTPDTRRGTGSLGHRVNESFGSSFTSGSPGQRVINLTQYMRPEFSRFSKKAQDKDIMIYIFVEICPTVIEVLTFNKNDMQNFTFQKRANVKQR